MSEETELPCEGGPWHGRTYALSADMRGVRLADGEEGWLNVHGEGWLGWYERVDDRLVWRGPAGMEPSEPAPALPAIPGHAPRMTTPPPIPSALVELLARVEGKTFPVGPPWRPLTVWRVEEVIAYHGHVWFRVTAREDGATYFVREYADDEERRAVDPRREFDLMGAGEEDTRPEPGSWADHYLPRDSFILPPQDPADAADRLGRRMGV